MSKCKAEPESSETFFLDQIQKAIGELWEVYEGLSGHTEPNAVNQRFNILALILGNCAQGLHALAKKGE